MHIDWDFYPESIRDMAPEQVIEHLVVAEEKHKRIYHAVQEISRKLDAISPRTGEDVPHRTEIDMILNPDKLEYLHRPERHEP